MEVLTMRLSQLLPPPWSALIKNHCAAEVAPDGTGVTVDANFGRAAVFDQRGLGWAVVRQNQTLGTLATEPALDRPDLLAPPVVVALDSFADAAQVFVAQIDAELADTAAFCAAYDVALDASANCVVVSGKRAGEVRWAAAVILATSRADVNGVVRRRLDVRKVSFAPMADATTITGMEYGGITPFGLPAGWPILIDAAVPAAGLVVVGSGIRGSKIVVDGAVLAGLPGATVIDGLATATAG
jgi:prolyl-tRNA editing enzyme YbaK/EbsC (Cys-tRNA(Pro) deacylase)